MRDELRGICLVALLGLSSTQVLAQEPVAAPTTTRIMGTVLDLGTELPLHGAFVAPQGLLTGFLADSAGRFVLDLPTAPVYYLYVERLGYHTTRLAITADEALRPLQIMVRPDPVLLEGVEVLVDRYQQRRRFFAGSVRAFDQMTLLRSGNRDALSFVRARGGARVRQCPNDPLSWCVWRRGRLHKMQVCLDEMPLFDGGRALETFIPQDFYLIEVYDQGMQIRAYTEHFVKQTAMRRSPVRPLIMGC